MLNNNSILALFVFLTSYLPQNSIIYETYSTSFSSAHISSNIRGISLWSSYHITFTPRSSNWFSMIRK